MPKDPSPAAQKPAPETPEAAELPPPEDAAGEAPRGVMLMPPVPLVALDPPEIAAWELLDVITTEMLEPPDAALQADPSDKDHLLNHLCKNNPSPPCVPQQKRT